jgi:hypothetical protein
MRRACTRGGLWLLALAVLWPGLAALGQGPTEREVISSSPNADKPGEKGKDGDKGPEGKSAVWSLDFRFKDPRIIKVHVPGKGTRIYYYLWYQVINRTGQARQFTPLFELVTLDYPGNYLDRIEPAVLDAIKKVEDPTGFQDIKSSVEISTDKIPVSKPPEEAFPRAVTGAAIWEVTPTDPAKRDPKVKDIGDSASFSIFVRGLSNANVVVDALAPGLDPVVRYKTLELKFKRRTERFSLDSRDIQFVPQAEWVYRPGPRRDILGDLKEPEKKEEK